MFSGPTLPPDEVHRLLPDAEIPGPAEQGDVYDACRGGAEVIAIVDGYFEHRLAPWHKEILWALDRGVTVYGGASLGALRAAELAAFGMRGVGRIFERFQSGELEDDDEVAIVHRSAAEGFEPLSEALVNVRFTLEAAVAEGVLPSARAADLIAIGKALFYPERTLGAIVAEGRRAGIISRGEDRLEAWLGSAARARVDQKRADALALVEVLRTPGVQAPAATRASFDFSYTELWHELRRERDEMARGTVGAPRLDLDERSVEEGLRLAADLRDRSPAAYDRVVAEAAARALGVLLADRRQVSPPPAELQARSDAFRRRHGLLSQGQTLEWMQRTGMTLTTFTRFIRDDALAEEGRGEASRMIAARVAEVLLCRETGGA